MKVVVLGGTGFIGSHLVRELASRSCTVHVFHRGQTRADLPDSVRYLHGDRNDLPTLFDSMRSFKPDVFVDMIALTEAHARATLALCRGRTRRIVAISSMDVYRAFDVFHGTDDGGLAPVPIREDDELRATLYPSRQADDTARPDDRPRAYEKILVERVLREQSDVPATLLRLPIVFGPGDAVRRRTLPYVKRMSDGRSAILMSPGLSRWIVSRAYVKNVAWGIAEAIVNDRSSNRTYNLADEPALSELEWAQTLADVTGWKGRLVRIAEEKLPPGVQLRGNFAQHLVLDTSRIREDLGYREQTQLADALRQTVAWDLENPPVTVPADAFPYAAEDAVLTDG